MRIYSSAIFSVLLLGSGLLYADTAQTGALTLQRGGGAKAEGLGQSFVSIPGQIQSLGYNPAGLSHLPYAEVSATYLNGMVDDSLGTLTYGQPVPFGTLFVGALYFDGGSIDLNLSSGLQEQRNAQQDIVGMVGFGLGRNIPLSIGVTGKLFRLELAETVNESGYALDSGLLWKTPLKNFNLGGSAQNIGPDVKFEQDSDPLPLTYRFGASYSLDLGQFRAFRWIPIEFLLTSDGVKQKEEDLASHSGLEIKRNIETENMNGSAAFRIGYISDPQTVNVGVGANLSGFSIDYAISLFDELDETHRVTLSYYFLRKDTFDPSRLKKRTLSQE
ncbi:hypothetical protein BVX98_06370 [bacterium F11]|nr:hypothetical protein BVX98_06370 [bacterium F11]